MILQLIRQDPVMGYLKVATPLYFLAGLFVRVVAETYPAGFGTDPISSMPGMVVFLHCCVCFLVFFALIPTCFWVRSGSLYVSLPLSPRSIWVARMAALGLAVFVPVTAMSLGISLGASGGTRGFVPSLPILGLGLHTATAWFLTVLFCHLPGRKLQSIPLGPGNVAYFVMIAVAALLYSILTPPFSGYTLVLLVGILFAGLWTYRSLPGSFLVWPTGLKRSAEPVPEGSISGAERRRSDSVSAAAREISGAPAGDGAWFFHRTIGRVLMNHWGFWLILSIIVFYSAVTTAIFYDGKSPFPYVIFLAVWFWAIPVMAATRLATLDALPVSRVTIYAHAMIPGVLALLLGIGIEHVNRAIRENPPKLIQFRECKLQVPHEFREIAWDGRPSELSAPWGEGYRPSTHPIFRGTRPAVYSPFDHGGESSARFVEWQLDRAIERIHGVSLPKRERHASQESICSAVQREGFVVHTPAGLPSTTRSKSFAVGTMLFCVVGSILTAFALRSRDRKPDSRIYGVIPLAAIGCVALCLVGAAVADGLGLLEMWVVGAFLVILLRQLAEAIPLGPTMIWWLAVAVFVGCYSFVQWRFRKIEGPSPRMVKPFIKPF